MSNTLNYKGDRTNYDPEAVLGPDLHGAHYRIIGADYDPDTDMTKLRLRPFAFGWQSGKE